MSVHKLILKLHLYLVLTAAIFLLVLGVTGSIMAFEANIDHWVHPHDWYVTPAGRPLSEADLVGAVGRQVSPARVRMMQIAP